LRNSSRLSIVSKWLIIFIGSPLIFNLKRMFLFSKSYI
jgi:hypothetical protein